MPIKQLYPPVERSHINKNQCQAVVIESPHLVTSKWRAKRYGYKSWDAEKCQRQAQYEIDDVPYCGLHAAKLALKLWVGGRLIDAAEKNR